MREEWLPIVEGLIGSTILSLAVSGLVMHRTPRPRTETRSAAAIPTTKAGKLERLRTLGCDVPGSVAQTSGRTPEADINRRDLIEALSGASSGVNYGKLNMPNASILKAPAAR